MRDIMLCGLESGSEHQVDRPAVGIARAAFVLDGREAEDVRDAHADGQPLEADALEELGLELVGDRRARQPQFVEAFHETFRVVRLRGLADGQVARQVAGVLPTVGEGAFIDIVARVDVLDLPTQRSAPRHKHRKANPLSEQSRFHHR